MSFNIKSIDELSLPDARNGYIPLCSKCATCRVSSPHHTVVVNIHIVERLPPGDQSHQCSCEDVRPEDGQHILQGMICRYQGVVQDKRAKTSGFIC